MECGAEHIGRMKVCPGRTLKGVSNDLASCLHGVGMLTFFFCFLQASQPFPDGTPGMVAIDMT